MAIHKPFVASGSENTHTFPVSHKEDFVLRAVETRANCFEWYDEWFIKDLFSQDYASQSDFDVVANRLLDFGIDHYFTARYDANNPNSLDEATWAIKALIDWFAWSFNDFNDKIKEHANEYAETLVNDMLENTKKRETTNTINTIFSRIPECVRNKSWAKKYFQNKDLDIENIFVSPNVFASQCDFATLQEQSVIAHVIRLEFETLVFLLEKSKKEIRDTIDPLEIDAELFSKINKLHALVFDWRNRAISSVHSKIMNNIYTNYVVTCLTNTNNSKIKS